MTSGCRIEPNVISSIPFYFYVCKGEDKHNCTRDNDFHIQANLLILPISSIT